MKDFFNLYRHGFARLALATPTVRIGDPAHNLDATLALMQQAAREKAVLVVFPELGLSAYSCEDLFHQQALIDAAEEALAELLRKSRTLPLAALVGLPVALDGLLYNCAALVSQGRLAGVVPKTYLPNYREFYEGRQFTPGDTALKSEIRLAGQRAPFGAHLLFALSPKLVVHAEICEDLWVPTPPSSFAALAGATVIANLSASNVVVGKEGYRHQLVANQSARCIAAYLYSAAGMGESTTDLAWDGHALAYENGTLIAESRRFADAPQLALADVDLDRLLADRMRHNTFGAALRGNFPLLNLSQPLASPTAYNVAGPSCNPTDLLGVQVLLPEAQPGDLIGVAMSGSYGLTASPMLFLGRDTPAELVVDRGLVRVGRRRHTLAAFN